MTLLDELGQLLGKNEPNLTALAGFLEADDEATSGLLDCSLPALLGGLAHRTQSDSGAEAVFGLVSDHDGSLVHDVAGFIGAGDSQSIGSSLVGSILGRQRNLVEQELASTSGMGVGSVAKFLPRLAPLVMSFLGKKVAGGGLNEGGLASMLDDNLASMSAGGHDNVLTSLGEVPTDVEAADTSFLNGIARVADLGGLNSLVGVGAATAAMPTLERAQAPTQFRDAIVADATVADATVADELPTVDRASSSVVERELTPEVEEISVDAEAADVDVEELDVEEIEAVDVDAEELEAEEIEAADGDVDEHQAIDHVDTVVDEPAVASTTETATAPPTTEIHAEENTGAGWLKWLLPLLALAALAWLILSLVNSGPDEIVGNDLGGRDVTIGVETMPDGDTEGAGWDFDVWHEACEIIDCKAKFVAAPWPGVLDQVANGEIEAAVNGISITEDRRGLVDFSDPYLTIEQKMLVAGDNDTYVSTTEVIDDQAAMVGARAGTVDYELAQRLVPEERIQTFEGLDAVVAALVSGDIDAVVFEDASGVGYVGADADQVRAVDGTFGTDDLGFVFPPGSEYVGPVNHAIAEMRSNGTLDELARQYLAAS